MIGLDSINGWAAGAATTGFGLYQYHKGKKMGEGNERPNYEIPVEIAQNLNQGQHAAQQGMPQEQKQQFLNNLNQGTAYGLSQLGARNAGLAGVAQLNQNQNQGFANLAAMDSQARMANQDKLYGLRNQMADYKGQAFQLNQLNPYYEKLARSEAMKGAGIQNIGNSFQIAQGGGNQGNTSNPSQGNQQQRQMSADSYYNGMNYNQGTAMNSNQMQGVNQNTTFNPYSNQQELPTHGLSGGSFWG